MPTVEELQAQLDELSNKYKATIEENKTYRARAQKAEADNEAARKLAEEANAKAQQAELESKGKYEEALKVRDAQYAKELAARDAAIKERDGAIASHVGQSALLAALGKAGVKSDLIAQAARLVGPQVKVELKDGQAVVVALDDKGTPLDSIDTLAATFAKGNPHFLPPSGGGSGAAAGSGGQTGETRYGLLKKGERAVSEFIKTNGLDAYNKLPAK